MQVTFSKVLNVEGDGKGRRQIRSKRQLGEKMLMGGKIGVMIADDHPVVRAGISSFLSTVDHVIMAGEAKDGREAVDMARVLRPAVILMDLRMPRMNGVEAIREILASQPDVRVVILTGSGFESLVIAAIRAGAVGYLNKDANCEKILDAIQRVHCGKLVFDPAITRELSTSLHMAAPDAMVSHHGQAASSVEISRTTLTPRRLEILRCLAQNLSNQQIASRLRVAASTVRSHLSQLSNGLGFEGREDLLHALLQARRGEPSPLPRAVAEQLEIQLGARSSRTSPLVERLTRREIEVAAWLAKGLSNQQIGDQLSISETTVRTHISRLLKKLSLVNRVEVAIYALRRGWAELD